MINIDKFISEYITKRPTSMFLSDIESYSTLLEDEIKNSKILVIGGAGTIGSSFIRAVMAKISPETLDTPIYNSSIDLKSKKSINQYDKDFHHQLSLKQKVKLLLKVIIPVSRKINYNHTEELTKIHEKYSSSEMSQIFDKEFLIKNIEQFGNKENSILSLMMYFHQLEQSKGR